MKNDSLAIVPLGVDKLEMVKVDRSRKLTDADKKRLLEVVNKKLRENWDLLRARRDEASASVIEAEKEKAGLPKYRADLDKIEEEMETMRKRADTIRLRCQNSTGFTVDGALVTRRDNGGYGSDDSKKLWDIRNRQAINKAEAIMSKVELAKQVIDRYGLKFDKVESRMILASTYGEAMDILDAVLGNGDSILKAEDKGTDEF